MSLGMEPCFQAINGISLERYAALGAATADVLDDQAKLAEVLASEGVGASDWDAAKKGWTARMQAGGVVPGASVLVTHPANRQKYPARVLSTAPEQTLVQFSNGAQQWVPARAVERA